MKFYPKLESELLSKSLLEPPMDLPSDQKPSDLHPDHPQDIHPDHPPDQPTSDQDHPPDHLPPELLQLIFSNLHPVSLKYDFPFNRFVI